MHFRWISAVKNGWNSEIRYLFSSYFKDQGSLRQFFHCVLKILKHRYHTLSKLIWWSIIGRIYTLKEGIAKKGDNYLSTFKYGTETIHIIKHNRIKIIDFVKRSKKYPTFTFRFKTAFMSVKISNQSIGRSSARPSG